MTEHLLLISIGPIQDFIATARRCQDLWFGSWLLSDLSRAVAEAVKEENGVIIFPASLNAQRSDEDSPPGVANLILAQVSGSPADIAKTAQEALTKRLFSVAEKAWRDLKDDNHFYRAIAKQQLSELIEYIWVAVPLTTYSQSRAEAYRRLAMVKNTRDWSQPPWEQPTGHNNKPLGIPKSSLDGKRESVLKESIYKQLSEEHRRNRYGIKGNERLCGIGLLKRLGLNLEANTFREAKPSFHSTAHVAMGPLLNTLNSCPEYQKAAQTYTDTLTELNLNLTDFRTQSSPSVNGYDGSLLVVSRLKDHFETHSSPFNEQSESNQKQILKKAEVALKALFKAINHRKEPCPYYAFLLADGDRMGKAIDGIHTMKGHQALGTALDSFASSCETIVNKHQGSLIFAGGDDVLALLPLHTALACSRELARAFKSKVQPAVNTHWNPSNAEPRPKMSLSAGLAITHFREPMYRARLVAKRAEQLAKEPRDALAIVLSKRGGGERSACAQWGEDSPTSLDKMIHRWCTLLNSGALSSKTAHNLEEIVAHYGGLPEEELVGRSGEISALVAEVLGRKNRRGGETGNAEAISAIVQFIGNTHSPLKAVAELASQLLISKLFIDAYSDSNSDLNYFGGLQ